MSKRRKRSEQDEIDRSFDEWATSVQYLKWPLIFIIVFIFLLVFWISVSTPNQ
ncbi:hypothetical protein [Flavilitoribacter nigricans]|uniref:hypothetical protein n=1 Tax=Flavilitoribacter nigricans TaxID=70997 RepID=UPI0014738843|nr:hypothetical protein [Flavilitoribacter nigricans]